MPETRKKLINKLITEGFTHRTLSLFSDTQLKELGKKLFEQGDDYKVKEKQALSDLIAAKTAEINAIKSELGETETDEELDIETDDIGNPDVEIDGTPLLKEKQIEEDFASKAQQKYLYAVNPAAADKLASKMTKKDYEDLPEKVNEEKVLEEWVTSLVEKNNHPEITKKNFIKTIKEYMTPSIEGSEDNPFTIATVPQKESFDIVTGIGAEMEPPMDVEVDGFDDEGHLNGYLRGDESENVIELNICPAGDIKLNGVGLGESELVETDRDDDGEYIGAPEATTAPAPLKTPTIAPSKPGEKKRRGPFQKPKTTPKPKAKKNSPLPDWLEFTNLGKELSK